MRVLVCASAGQRGGVVSGLRVEAMQLPFEVKTSDGVGRRFASFAAAERWARWHVAESAHDKYARSARIEDQDGWCARVHLDSANRVWTDMLR